MLPKLHFEIERWKFNKDYGVYVSTFGHFKDRHKRNLPLRTSGDKGYLSVVTEKGFRSAHRLTMLTWKPIPDAENLTVDHLDHNKRNNKISNLEWVTQKENWNRANQDYAILKEKGGKIIEVPKKKKKKKQIIGYEINGCQFKTLDEGYAILIKIYPCGYPKESLQKKMETLKKHPENRYIKCGKSATIKPIKEKGDN